MLPRPVGPAPCVVVPRRTTCGAFYWTACPSSLVCRSAGTGAPAPQPGRTADRQPCFEDGCGARIRPASQDISLGSLGFSGPVAVLNCGGAVLGSGSPPGRVTAVPRDSPCDLAREWHGHFWDNAPRPSRAPGCLGLSRRQSATTESAPTDQARVCLAVPSPTSATPPCRRPEQVAPAEAWQ